jgi:hypothetical protein
VYVYMYIIFSGIDYSGSASPWSAISWKCLYTFKYRDEIAGSLAVSRDDVSRHILQECINDK